ncbi:hypothetical protein SAMN05216553_112119 [Lentzea fradiae]|uniref:Uncharacterized protein n=1 Tax=Lentzea fradiae TaxID=200378 RepID=A0A1G7XN45_9PSEU|nr:hypothetical protein [Lentzea fradiae]SDG85617.1 hypothetical protein SAMN05216553_112119 [Lentzea fradiae]
MEQSGFMLPDGEHDLLRRLRQLAERAERTAHNRSNFVGPPPSQEHLDILAEIRALSEEMTASRRKTGRPGVVPHPARAADELIPHRN